MVIRVRAGVGKFWKVMEIEKAFFQDLESSRKGRIFKNDYGKVLNFCLEKFYPILKWM